MSLEEFPLSEAHYVARAVARNEWLQIMENFDVRWIAEAPRASRFLLASDKDRTYLRAYIRNLTPIAFHFEKLKDAVPIGKMPA